MSDLDDWDCPHSNTKRVLGDNECYLVFCLDCGEELHRERMVDWNEFDTMMWTPTDEHKKMFAAMARDYRRLFYDKQKEPYNDEET